MLRRARLWLPVAAATVVAGLALLPGSASASAPCAKVWVGGFSTNWEDWQNWTQCDANPNNQEPPDSDDAVSIDNANVNLSSGTSIASLTLGHTTAATLTLSAAAANSNINSAGDITIGSGSTLTLTCPGGGCFGGPGGAPKLLVGTSTIENDGTITIAAAAGGASGGGGLGGNVNNTGSLNVDSSALTGPDGGNGILDNTGTITIANGMTLSSGGSSCGDTSANVIDDTGGTITASGTGSLAAVNYTQGDGTTGGTATYPVNQQCGFLHYTGSGASTILANYGLKLSGTSHAGQNLTIRADHNNSWADARVSGFTNGGTITLDCPGNGCAGGSGDAPAIDVGTHTLTNTGTITSTANASGGGGFRGNVNNSGTITVNGSVVSMPDGGNAILDNTGTITIANGMTLLSGGSSCGDTSTAVIDDTGGTITANGNGLLAAVNYTQGDGTAGGTSPYPVVQTCGYLHYTGSGASTILAPYGFKLTGASHPGQNLTIRADHNNTYADATAGGFTNGGTITLDCVSGGCAGGPGGAPSIDVGTNTLTNSGTITVTANASGGGGFYGNVTNTGTFQVNGNAKFAPSGTSPTLLNQGTINLADGVALTANDGTDTVTNDTGGQIDATGSGALVSGGTFNEGAGTTSGSFPVVIDGGTLNYTGSGASTILANAGFTLSGPSHANQNLTIRADNYNTVANATASGFTNGGSLTLDCSGGGCAGGSGGAPSINVGANTFTNNGTFTVTANASGGGGVSGNMANAGTIAINGDAQLTNGGTLSQSAGQTTIASGAHFNADGTMTLSGGTLSGAGTLTGSVSNTGGTVAPGSSPGTLTVTGNYTQGAGGTLKIAVDGTSAGQFSVLNVGGSPTLAGTLSLKPSAGYAAAAATGDRVGFLTYTGALSGTFGAILFNPPPSLNNGRIFTVDYTPTGHVDAVVSPPTPKLSHVSLSPRAFLAKKGTTLKFTLSTPAKIDGVVKDKAKGRKRLTFAFQGHTGPNSFKLKTRALKPGKYRLTFDAVNPVGLSSNGVTLAFTVKKP